MRIRIHFSKTEAMRFTGHLDLHKAWERTLRRAGLPLAYSQGFHPQPKINLACALPLGFTSDCELVDIRLENEISLEEIQAKLEPALPPGIRIDQIETIDLHAPALQTEVESVEYTLTFLVEAPELDDRLEEIRSAETLPRVRRGKAYDLRPLIEEIQTLSCDEANRSRLKIRLAAREGATGRPEEFILAIGAQPVDVRYHRTRLVMHQGTPAPTIT